MATLRSLLPNALGGGLVGAVVLSALSALLTGSPDWVAALAWGLAFTVGYVILGYRRR